MLPVVAWIAAVAGIAWAAMHRGMLAAQAVLWMAGCALVWTGIVAAMAQDGFAGIPRFLFMVMGLTAVVAGVGTAASAEFLLRSAGRLRAPRRRRAGVVAVLCVLPALLLSASASYGSLIPADLRGIAAISASDAGLGRSVERAGGDDAVLRCGRPATTWYAVPVLAWDLGVPTRLVAVGPVARNVFFRPVDGAWGIARPACPAHELARHQPGA